MIVKHNTKNALRLIDTLERSAKEIVVTSGYFDPVHPGHISLFKQSKALSPHGILIVVLNGDQQCITKKGKFFMPAIDRAKVIQELECVDHVYIYDNNIDTYSTEALDFIKPHVYAKGGDWVDIKTLPEAKVCKQNKIQVVFNIGDPKEWSSSDYLKDWVTFANSKAI